MLEHASPASSERLRDLVGHVLGLRVDDDGLASLRDLVDTRMRAVGRVDLDRYGELLAGSTAEAGELARHLCVNETYVLRNIAQFEALARWLERRSGTHASLRMLSAGCSSGDEAFSLAIVACRALAPTDLSRTEIVGVDLDPEAIRIARTGRVSTWSLRSVPAEIRARWFTEADHGHVLARPIRDMVAFRQENLLGPSAETWRPRSWDVVFCRNVLMYLTPTAAATLVARIADALVDGGLLLLGHAETLRGLSTDFDISQEPGAFLHVRRGRTGAGRAPVLDPAEGGEAVAEATEAGWFDTISRSTSRIEVLSGRRVDPGTSGPTGATRSVVDLERAMRLFAEDKFEQALHALERPDGEPTPGVEAVLMRAVLLANGGRVAEAERECDAMLTLDGPDARAHYVKALCREQSKDLDGALEHDRVAAYLDPTFAMPRLHAGLLLRRLGETKLARAALSTALRLLVREEPQRIVLFGGGFGREALLALCRSELMTCGGGT